MGGQSNDRLSFERRDDRVFFESRYESDDGSLFLVRVIGDGARVEEIVGTRPIFLTVGPLPDEVAMEDRQRQRILADLVSASQRWLAAQEAGLLPEDDLATALVTQARRMGGAVQEPGEGAETDWDMSGEASDLSIEIRLLRSSLPPPYRLSFEVDPTIPAGGPPDTYTVLIDDPAVNGLLEATHLNLTVRAAGGQARVLVPAFNPRLTPAFWNTFMPLKYVSVTVARAGANAVTYTMRGDLDLA